MLTVERPDLLAAFSYEPLKGLTTAEAFRKVGIGEEPQLSRCVITKQQKYRRLVAEGHLLLLRGARSALDVARANKRRLFLVTSGSAGSISLALAKLGIADFFEGIVTSDDVPRGKPAPDPYRFCIEQFGLTLAQSIAIEDLPSGVCSARAAGLRVIGVNNPEIRTLVDCFFSGYQSLCRIAEREVRGGYSEMKTCAVIPAAGRGTRLGLDRPKILAPLSSSETIWSVLRRKLLAMVDHIHVILSPEGERLFRQALASDCSNGRISIGIQPVPAGMGDAIFCGHDVWCAAEILLVIWGDQVFVSEKTLCEALGLHGASPRTLVLPVVSLPTPYVEYIFDPDGRLAAVRQSREGEQCSAGGLERYRHFRTIG